MPKAVYIDKKKLQDLYLIKKLSSYEISRFLNCSQSLIMKRLKEFSTKTRSIQEAKALTKPRYKRKNFNNKIVDKAYIIGFRIGDLYVSKTHPNSPTIRISTNTTKDEQVQLIQELFSSYGHVKQYNRDKRGAITVRAFVNNSFSFLLKREDKIEPWILENKNVFTSFLAGYIDAEGSFVYKKNKVFSIQTHDKKILCQISEKLNNYGIDCMKPKISRKINSVNNGINSNKDVWTLYIYNRENLLKLINLLKEYIRHPKRKNDMLILFKTLNYVRT